MPGRSFSSNSYRYGFNGKEQDPEVKGIGLQYDYGFRIYDPRLGRFLSVDPLSPEYPWYTPYQFAGNTPIMAIDLDGLEEYHYLIQRKEIEGKVVFIKIYSHTLYERMNKEGIMEKIEGEEYLLTNVLYDKTLTYSFESKKELLDWPVVGFLSMFKLPRESGIIMVDAILDEYGANRSGSDFMKGLKGLSYHDKWEKLRAATSYGVIVGSFESEDNAKNFAKEFEGSVILPSEVDGKQFFRVSVGSYKEKGDALTKRNEINKDKASKSNDSWILKTINFEQ